MKDPEKSAESRTLKTLEPASKGNGFPEWLVDRICDEYDDETYPDCAPRSSSRTICLSDELERSFKNPPWSLVDHVVRTLDPGDFNSYARLHILMKKDFVSDGERRDIVRIDHVLETFHQGLGMPTTLDWRVLDI